jgi:ABC-type glycerol-3-phosphate transport system substrate-binding protein
MLSSKAFPVLMAAAVAVGACAQDKTETKTTTETKQVGSTQESKTTTKVDSPSGDTTAVTKTLVGTVTAYTPGKRIEVMTGDKDTQSFDLDGKDDVVRIDSRTAVGSKVQLVEEKPEGGIRRISVTIAPAA